MEFCSIQIDLLETRWRKIIYLMVRNNSPLKFPTYWVDTTPQGKFISLAGQSKYYIDNLSQNVKRGIEKLRRGEWPLPAPIGYKMTWQSTP